MYLRGASTVNTQALDNGHTKLKEEDEEKNKKVEGTVTPGKQARKKL